MTAVESRTADEQQEDRTVGAWEATFVGWRVFVPVVVVNAAVQAATVLSDPVPGASFGFVALLLGSVASLLVAVWFTVGAADAIVAGRVREAWRSAVRHPMVLVWALGLGVVAVAASLLAVWLLPVVLAVGAFLLPPPATGRSRVGAALRTPAHRPVRSVLLVIAALVAAALSAVIALVLGLFLSGAASAGILWLWLGFVGTVVLCRYCVVSLRARG